MNSLSMKYLLILLTVATIRLHADVIIDASNNNGGFVSATSSFNGSPDGWIASSGVWVADTNSSLTTDPFGADSATNSRYIQIHKDSGEVLTSAATFIAVPDTAISLSFDYKTSGSGNNTTLTVTLWDSVANTTYATFGTLSTATSQAAFTMVTYSTTPAMANSNLRLRFTLSSAGGLGKDFNIDRVHLSGGTIIPPTPPVPIEYATVQQLLTADTDARIVEKAAKLLPRSNQVSWQRQEMTFFIHYGPNTFNGVEWGTGHESPNVFNPTAFDANQWVREIKNAGGKMVMLVCKHHDGFCMWPSRYTTQDVASSSWLGGNGDVVRAVSDACAAAGLNFGIYLSPADLYQIHNTGGYYGNSSDLKSSTIPTDPSNFLTNPSIGRTPPSGMPSVTYTVDDYNRYFLNQLYELLTEYGPIREVWFDGANPDSSTTEIYNYTAYYELIHTLRPDAVIAVGGPDVRWVGNESGVARESEWSAVPGGQDATTADLGSRSKLTRGSTLTWHPAECDVPVLNGWFWNASKTAKSVASLLGIYYTSIGRNATLLLNVSPDTRGLIPENQLAPLHSMSQVVGQTFATQLSTAAMGSADSENSSQPATLAADGNLDTWWEPEVGQTTATFILTLTADTTFDVIALQEATAQRGQRVESFGIDTWNGSSWIQQATATTIGYKRLIKLTSPVTSQRVRVRILQSRLEPTLAEVSLYRQADLVAEPTIARSAAGQVTLLAVSGETIRYTIDGSEPTANSTTYDLPFDLVLGGTVRAVSYRTNGSHSLSSASVFGIASSGWSATADTAQASNPASYAIDGNSSTYWHTAWDATSGLSTPQPHWLRIDMGAARWIGGFTYLPRQDGVTKGIIKNYRCETSTDDTTWTTAVSDTFANIKNNPVEQSVAFPQDVKARYLRFVTLEEVDGRTFASAAELSILPGGFDAWRIRKGLQNTSNDTDSDGDGRSNWQEYAQGSDPLNCDQVSQLLEWTGTPQRPGLHFNRPPEINDVVCTLQAVATLGDSWQDVPAISEIIATSGDGSQIIRYEETHPPEAAIRRFYRLCYVSQP